MLRSATPRRAVYETIPILAWVIALNLLIMGATCVASTRRQAIDAGTKAIVVGLAALLVRRRVVCDRAARTMTIHWAVSLAPRLPALNLHHVAAASLDMFRGVFVGSHNYRVYNPQTRRNQVAEEHDIRFLLDDRAQNSFGLGSAGTLIARVSRLGGRARALHLGQQIADDLGLPFHERFGDART